MVKKDNLKRIIALASVLIILYNSFGYIIFYRQIIQFTKDFTHSAIERKEIDEEIIMLSFKKEDIIEKKIDFIWKHSKEFKYNGGMYDIVEQFETEDSIHFFCFYDHKENKLEESFSMHLEREKGDSKKNSSSGIILSKITDQYLISENLFHPRFFIVKYFPFPAKENPLNEPDVPSPPPKFYHPNPKAPVFKLIS